MSNASTRRDQHHCRLGPWRGRLYRAAAFREPATGHSCRCGRLCDHPAGARAIDLEDSLLGWESSFGVGELWVGGLWPDGVIAARPEFLDKDGLVGMKFGWWRRVAGDLTITGRRLMGRLRP